jgi:hypothetical protein
MLRRILLSCGREFGALSANSSIPLRSHQGEREKNEYLYDGKNAAQLSKEAK